MTFGNQTRISHHLTTEAHDRPAITSLRLLAVLNVLSSTPALVKRRAPRTDGPLTRFASPRGEKSGLTRWLLLLVLAAAAIVPRHAAAANGAARAPAAWPMHTIDDSSRGADGVRLRDVNGDGLPDIATGWEEGGRVRIYLNPGPRKVREPWPAVTVGEVASPEDAVFADLDGDGAADVVSSCEGKTRTIFFHWAPSEKERYLDPAAWKTQALSPSAGMTQWMFALPLSIDGKNGIDLVAGAKGEDAQIGWWESPRDPRDVKAWKWHPLYDAGWIMSLAAHDMDGDGDLDVVASDRYSKTSGSLWLENPGPERAAKGRWREHRIGAAGGHVMFLKVADLDQDGLDDVVVTTRDRKVVYHRRTQASPVRWESHEIPFEPNTGTGKGVAAADIDLDGKTDLVLTFSNAKEDKTAVTWLSYRGSPTNSGWSAHEIGGRAGIKFDRIEMLDLDQDGDLDLITCEERDNLGVIWYENPTR